LIASVVERHGYDGLALATVMAGVIMVAMAAMRVGSYIRLIPHSVIVGFTAGIAVIIAVSQFSEMLGLRIAHEPVDLIPKLITLHAAASTISWQAVLVASFVMAIIVVMRRLRPTWPALLIAIIAGTLLTLGLHLDVATVLSRFGEVPRSLPAPVLPDLSTAKMLAVLPDAIAIALLGAIESLLSAMVADRMGSGHHRSNGELGAQGIANVGSALFGGICVTGTIARTATNIRAGAHGPVAGMLHSGYLLLFLAIAAPAVGLVPLAALGAMLLIVAWNMVEREELVATLLGPRSEAAILLATFLLTIFVNLLTGIAAGVALAVGFHILRKRTPA
jgi:SulP family sulfate permease